MSRSASSRNCAGSSSYVVPKVDVAARRRRSRASRGRCWPPTMRRRTRLSRRRSGGRFRGTRANVTVNLDRAGHDVRRPHQSTRFPRRARRLKLGRSRTRVGVDIYNAAEFQRGAHATTTRSCPADTWLQPLTILTPRFFKLTAEIDVLNVAWAACDARLSSPPMAVWPLRSRCGARRAECCPGRAGKPETGARPVLDATGRADRHDRRSRAAADHFRGGSAGRWTTTPNTSTCRGFPIPSIKPAFAISCA